MADLGRAVGWTRRDFFRVAGIGSGALALGAYASGNASGGPGARAAVPRPADARPPSIIALVPALRDASALADDFLVGLRLALGESVRLVVEEIPTRSWHFGERIGNRIERERAALVVGLLGAAQAIRFHERLPSRETVLLAASAGETIVREGMTHPYLFHHGLSTWQASWALGQWAARNVGHRAALAASFYDSGYDTLAAFQLGFEQAGGEVVQIHLTHLPTEAGEPLPLIAPIAASRPDFVFAAYSGGFAVDFIRAYAESELAGRVPLLGTDFLTGKRVLQQVRGAATGIITASSWGNPGNAASGAFRTAYAAHGRGEPGAFALLGYETALIAVAALAQVASGMATAATLRDALASVCIDGPRGCVTMQPRAQSTSAPVFLRRVAAAGAAAVNETIAELAMVGDLDAQLAALRSSQRSGWLNTYLGI
jgi:branched-chain amino acid transport system substrate-binding protein